jgi:type V secretory pathway adhesin AidA
MARPESTGRRPGPSRLLLPAAAMAGVSLILSFGVTRVMERILAAQGGEAVATDERPDRTSAAEAAGQALPLQSYQRAILERDIFASRHHDQPSSPPPRAYDPEAAKLIATVVTNEQAHSSALISLGAGEQQLVRVYVAGDRLAGDATITGIDQGRVTLHSGGGQVQHLELGGPRVEL